VSGRFALLSDVHGRSHKLEAVLADARARSADRIVSLGDVGGDDCVGLLRQAGALAVFGNYEVSGWKNLSSPHREWVKGWLPSLSYDGFLAVHAVPWWPKIPAPGVLTVEDLGLWMRRTGHSWRDLFPYIGDDEGHIWRALTELETAGRTILFHGHTHRQTIWRLGISNRLVHVRTMGVYVRRGERYVVGVGSVGLPEDGGWAAYTLYDSTTRHIEHVQLPAKPA
jgi:predicted phosphodiesterase